MCNKKFLHCLIKRKNTYPIWMFRQAGRYLPEYLSLRKKEPNFLSFCHNPDLCIEATMQPIRRYDLDAAIVFSDILVVPNALGQRVSFESRSGPTLEPLSLDNKLEDLSLLHFHEKINPVYQTIQGLSDLLKKKPLIGFSGAPWTLACYMIEGKGSRYFYNTRITAVSNVKFCCLIELLTNTIIEYLKRQIIAGIQAIQLFDSWAGILSPRLFKQYVIIPTQRIVTAIKADYPDIPIMGFARYAGNKNNLYLQKTGLSAISLDETIPLDQIPRGGIYQGNLDPLYLLSNKESLYKAVQEWKQLTYDRPWIYNLGHGIHKDTNPKMVELMIKWLRKS